MTPSRVPALGGVVALLFTTASGIYGPALRASDVALAAVPISETGTLVASDGAANDDFGRSVATDGDVIVVGAPGALTRNGKAYVFVRPDDGWSESPAESAWMSASPFGSSSGFGSKVAISGDIIVVGGAFLWDNRCWVSQAFVFVKPPSGWSGFVEPSATLTPSDYRRGNHGGNAIPPVVGIVGDTIVLADASAGKIYVSRNRPPAGLGRCVKRLVSRTQASILPTSSFRAISPSTATRWLPLDSIRPSFTSTSARSQAGGATFNRPRASSTATRTGLRAGVQGGHHRRADGRGFRGRGIRSSSWRLGRHWPRCCREAGSRRPPSAIEGDVPGRELRSDAYGRGAVHPCISSTSGGLVGTHIALAKAEPNGCDRFAGASGQQGPRCCRRSQRRVGTNANQGKVYVFER